MIAQAEVGDASRFRQVLSEYEKAPGVTRDRLYVDTMRDVYTNVSKVMVDVRGGSNLLYLPLDKLMQAAGTQATTAAGVAEPTPMTPAATVDTSRSRDYQRSREREGR